MVRMSSPLDSVVRSITEGLLSAPGHGPSAVAVGVSDLEHDLVRSVRGHARVLGLADPAPLADEPVFDVGSVTKVVVTTGLVMTLVDRRALGLDDPVVHWFPGLDEHITVRDLLEHQAGLWEWWPMYVAGATTAAEAMTVIQELPLRYAPRSGRHYSDLGFMLLGEIVAAELGAPLDEVAAAELFEPLGLRSTCFRPVERSIRVVATSPGDWYEQRMVDTGSPYPVPVRSDAFAGWRTHPLVGEVNDGNCWHAFGGVSGHAGLFTTVPDLTRFGRAVLSSLRGLGPWSADVVAEFVRPGRDAGQGLGFRVSPAGTVWHPGFPGARFAVVPDRGLVVALLTNRLHTTGEPRGIDPEWAQLIQAVEAG